ncbi:hypothetical protein HYE59_02260 [Aggregatibacter actinomycetemcomitans]|uniref:hypothetical protein n=1 Tax=Aggregatibacter actinomycetemcomitans TaxID=714 RepID=UPI00197B3671|nr:hypothetical protein [Aggregatibacter actinomycetemcomitans]MBN6074893.1 hypothetical protein [Aggregatibacter actinomycetemcomitans]MBN6076390.1 hypothetical protein [Aggregatibacter actinomycetemcomitans]
MKKLILMILCLFSQVAFSNDVLFTKVQQKLKDDPITFNQFQYLGILHCLDKYLRIENDGSFYNAYLELDLALAPITRLFTSDGLHDTYQGFEKNMPHIKRDSVRSLDFNNYINICQKEFSENKILELYNQFILNKNNYHRAGESNTNWDDEDVEQNMKDYLEFGKVDYRRFL